VTSVRASDMGTVDKKTSITYSVQMVCVKPFEDMSIISQFYSLTRTAFICTLSKVREIAGSNILNDR